MSRRSLAALGALALAAALWAAPAQAADAPALSLTSLATPTAFVAEDAGGEYAYDLRIANLGAKQTDGSEIVLTDTLPAGIAVASVAMKVRKEGGGGIDAGPEACAVDEAGPRAIVTCTISEALALSVQPAVIYPTEERRIVIEVSPGAIGEGTKLTNRVTVEGGGAPPAAIEVDNEAATLDEAGDPEPAPGGLAFFHAAALGPDGQPVGAAAAHPYQFALGFALDTNPPPQGSTAKFVPAAGDPKDISTALPAGFTGGGARPPSAARANASPNSTRSAPPPPPSTRSATARPTPRSGSSWCRRSKAKAG